MYFFIYLDVSMHLLQTLLLQAYQYLLQVLHYDWVQDSFDIFISNTVFWIYRKNYLTSKKTSYFYQCTILLFIPKISIFICLKCYNTRFCLFLKVSLSRVHVLYAYSTNKNIIIITNLKIVFYLTTMNFYRVDIV